MSNHSTNPFSFSSNEPFCFGKSKSPLTPSTTNTPPNPFADNKDSKKNISFSSSNEPLSTLHEQPAAKRRRIDIEPIQVKPRTDNVFSSKPPLTPTSPLVPPPNCPFQSVQTPVNSQTLYPESPFGLSGFSNDLDQIMNLDNDNFSDNDVQAFVDILNQSDNIPNFLPSIHFDPNELKDGTPYGIFKKIEDIKHRFDQLKTLLEHLRYEQRQMAVPIPHHEFEKLSCEISNLQKECARIREESEQILSISLLSPKHLHILLTLMEELEIVFIKLQLYGNELLYIASGQQNTEVSPCFSTLIVKRQPFPKSIKQNIKSTSSTEDAIIVELINAPKSDCRPVGKVIAEMALEANQPVKKKGKRNSLTIQNFQQTMNQNGQVRFPDLRFGSGTRLRIATLSFYVQVQYLQSNGVVQTTTIRSNKSNPFVVMTNENQWEASAGNLLKFYLFQNTAITEVPWCRFANYLQEHYTRATRQDVSNPTRPLSRYDLDYIQVNQFNGANIVTVESFTKFWDWFGKVLHSIRHQRTFLHLWLNGFVYGFISKTDAERLLQGQPVGTFVTRFSERRAGQVAIAFSKEDPITKRISIKHYLFDTQTNQIKNLPDFCKERVNLKYLPRLKVEYCPIGGNIESIVHKNEAFGEYYTIPQVDPPTGYDTDV